jgi:hypothetical protein
MYKTAMVVLSEIQHTLRALPPFHVFTCLVLSLAVLSRVPNIISNTVTAEPQAL